jgi:hypothetical protein
MFEAGDGAKAEVPDCALAVAGLLAQEQAITEVDAMVVVEVLGVFETSSMLAFGVVERIPSEEIEGVV